MITLLDMLDKVMGPERIRIYDQTSESMLYEGYKGSLEHHLIEDLEYFEVTNVHISTNVKKRQRVQDRVPVFENRTIAESCRTGAFRFADLEIEVWITLEVQCCNTTAGKR